MSTYQLPSIYLGSNEDGAAMQAEVDSRFQANRVAYPTKNLFLKHLIEFALQNDAELKKNA